MSAVEDKRRLIEARHDLDALEDLGAISTGEVQEAILEESRSLLSSARAAFVEALRAASRERMNAEKQADALKQAKGKAVERYRYVRRTVATALLAPDPDHPVSKEEMAEREKLIRGNFALNTDEFSSLSTDKMIATMGSLVDLMKENAALEALGLYDPVERDKETLISTRDACAEVSGCGSSPQESVTAAREKLNTELQAHSLLVASIMLRAGLEGELGKFIKGRDPAYQVRRRDGASLDEEPEADAVEAELAQPVEESVPEEPSIEE